MIDKPEPTDEHIDAVAQWLAQPQGDTSWERARDAARRILGETDPAVHAAQAANLPTDVMLTALVERGWKPDAEELVKAYSAAVDRVRRRHPRGDEEPGPLAPGLWCPTCGRERADNGYGGCPDRNALIIPGYPLRGVLTEPAP